MLPLSIEKRAAYLSLFIGPVVTLVVTPFWSYDPINLGKVLVLSTISFACLGLLIPYFGRLFSENKALLIIATSFAVALFSSFFFSGANKSQQFWGIWGRSTGILTYIALLLTLLVVALIQKVHFYQRLLTYLILTALLIGIYAMVQLSGNDPIQWSSYAAFGTLGNVNFLSGFMGIATVAMIVLALSKGTTNRTRITLLISGVLCLGIVYQTDSIQGLVAFAAGFTIYLLISCQRKGIRYFVPALLIALGGLVSLIFALFNKGPLAALVYQVTIIFRADYMHAGLKMLLNNPFFGVGIDSYDDWYRTERGVISAFRTSFNRTANSAHNVALDIGSGGGFPFLLAYLSLTILVIFSIVKSYKAGLFSFPAYCAGVCAWFAYQVQASVSINQVGVGVWGWILSGILIGFPKSNFKEINPKDLKYDFISDVKGQSGRSKKQGTNAPNTPPPLPVISSSLLAVLGFTLAFLPFRLDMDFRKATNEGELTKLMNIARNPISQAFQISQISNLALSNNFLDQGREMTELLVQKYPRSFFGWAQISSSSAFTPAQQALARKQILSIDPNQAICFNAQAKENTLRVLRSLPKEKQVELIRGWGIDLGNANLSFNTLSGPNAELVMLRVASFCG